MLEFDWRQPRFASIIAFAFIYLIAAGLSASTAFVQINAAAVWIPSGFAVGLLIIRGTGHWPSVALGAFIFNLALNLSSPMPASLPISVAVAVAIAAGNTCEAVVASVLARRFAASDCYLSQMRGAIAFALLAAPLPPLISTSVGIAASRLGGLKAVGSFWDVALTWYVGNYVGIMVFAGLTILALNGAIRLPQRARIGEALALTFCLCFVGQAIGGYFLTGWIGNWLQSYMAIPLVLWACFRFEIAGGPLSIALIATIAVIGTLRGYSAFPSNSPWLELIGLQVFIGMLSVISLFVSAAIAELQASRTTLEDRVRNRTKEIETLMREREVFTVLVAHDLQSPLYGVRNALRAAAAAVTGGHLSLADLGKALGVMEETCSTLADRVASLLVSSRDKVTAGAEESQLTLGHIVQRIVTAHGISLDASNPRIVKRGDPSLGVSRPDDIEHILDTLVDNALRYSPRTSPIDIIFFRHGRWTEIHVTDCGPGLDASTRRTLFRPRRDPELANGMAGSGLGLYLANEKAIELGGRLTFVPNVPNGCSFRLVVPS